MRLIYSSQLNVSSEVLFGVVSLILHFSVVNDGKILHNHLIMI